MKMFDPTNPPAIVRSAADQKAELTAAFAAFEDSGRKRLEAAIVIGRILSERKQTVGHGNWLPWLKAHFPYHRSRAGDFIRVFEGAAKCSRATTFEEALNMLGAASEPEPPASAALVHVPPPAPVVQVITTPVAPHTPPQVVSHLVDEPDEEPRDYTFVASLNDLAADVAGRREFRQAEGLKEEAHELRELIVQNGGQPVVRIPAVSAPGSEPARAPEPWMKSGNNTDSNNPFADILNKLQALSAAITKAMAADETGVLKEALLQVQRAKPLNPPFVNNRAMIIGDKHFGAQFTMFRPLRRLIRKSGEAILKGRKLVRNPVNEYQMEDDA